MSLADAFVESESRYKAQVMHATFGHLEAEPGTEHEGAFLFIYGQHGDMVVIESDFPTFGEGPRYFADRQDFMWDQIRDNGPCSEVGVYRFVGKYKRFKNGNTRFTGKIQRVDCPLLPKGTEVRT